MISKKKKTLKDICEYYGQIHGIKAATLQTAFYRSKSRFPPIPRRNLHQVLTDRQEQALIYTLQVFSATNISLKTKELKQLAEAAFQIKVSPNWSARFVKRHKQELTVRHCKALSKNRQTEELVDSVDSWVDKYSDYLDHHYFPAKAIFNFDETRINFTETGMQFKRIEWKARQKHNFLTSRAEKSMSLLSFLCADGSIFLSLYIFSLDFATAAEKETAFQIREASSTRSQGGWPRCYAFTQTGYLNRDVLASVILHFADLWTAINPGLEVLLLSDQLASHRDPVIVATAFDQGVKMFSLPANCSHFMQPCDDLYFAAFKQHLAKNHLDELRSKVLQGQSMANQLIQAAYDAEVEAASSRLIRRSWSNTGLHPYDPEFIKTKARLNLGGELGDEASKVARIAVSQVLTENRPKRQRTAVGRCVVRQNQICSPEGILRAHAENEARILREKLESTCREPDCDKKFRGGKTWKTCHCLSWKLCPKHKLTSMQCPCIRSPPPLSAQAESVVLLDDQHDSGATTSSLSTPSCPRCSVLIVDGVSCQFCAYRGHSNPLESDSEPDTEPESEPDTQPNLEPESDPESHAEIELDSQSPAFTELNPSRPTPAVRVSSRVRRPAKRLLPYH